MVNKCYIGIDPGEKGGLVCLFFREMYNGEVVRKIITSKMMDEQGCVEWLSKIKKVSDSLECIIEQQKPMPTFWEDKQTGKMNSSILRSTCILYGNYRMLCGILRALDIECITVLPMIWQANYGMKRHKGESTTKWKQRLKSVAHGLFPDIKITLDISDSLLLANYLWQMRVLE